MIELSHNMIFRMSALMDEFRIDNISIQKIGHGCCEEIFFTVSLDLGSSIFCSDMFPTIEECIADLESDGIFKSK